MLSATVQAVDPSIFGSYVSNDNVGVSILSAYLVNQFAASPARRKNRSIHCNRYNRLDSTFTTSQHILYGAVFWAGSHSTVSINANSNKQTVFRGDQCATDLC